MASVQGSFGHLFLHHFGVEYDTVRHFLQGLTDRLVRLKIEDRKMCTKFGFGPWIPNFLFQQPCEEASNMFLKPNLYLPWNKIFKQKSRMPGPYCDFGDLSRSGVVRTFEKSTCKMLIKRVLKYYSVWQRDDTLTKCPNPDSRWDLDLRLLKVLLLLNSVYYNYCKLWAIVYVHTRYKGGSTLD